MKKSKYAIVAGLLKKAVGINNFSLFRKRMLKKCGKIIYKKKYTAADIINTMMELGMKKGSVVCIHSSMMQFYNYVGSAEELINAIIDAIGPEGTLVMPAYPNQQIAESEGYIFDAKKDKTVAGYLAETFRKHPGVKRSLNVEHSVCAIGKYADYLLNEHQYSKDCWDKKSPYYKMC